MIHRTFRSLDDPPKLVGFTVKQWAALISGTVLLLGLIHLVRVPTKPAITLCVFVIGLPAALTYVSESGGLQLSVLLRSMWQWRLSTHTLKASPRGESSRARGLVILADTTLDAEEQLAGSTVDADEDGLQWERWG